ncbi:hypothetical protein ABB37_03080 [Leptomonas pyrrhocoris]|uniref:Uncharacterized protein n=1 Tax=Leptomonas pyrrhocoris TaxID=157538 RepID=A0A0N0VGF5_LEPPY|nr:hypothetical protein ABB37_03080 [Leptomonas pyrrhocoris]XP_015661893.1 hypothetical protein ABB37_03080 [Leptomonas pyrrhocoris]KPA83453.1 hypothetical protein ABB37_03080 [Leptomonas pyrrhocoris]KPA83454.1 hypothetical protein ABB37_03080 [Leptomonas pyrrhocoris]|eukprot:XP_015661892.1 hypothetical protein ABB37_03080 [Leptomonas pyrrhocoris]
MKSVKERDVAGMAAFELALQYNYIRQDRSYHFVQLLTALCSFVFFSQLAVINVLLVLVPLVPPLEPHVEFIRPYTHPLLFVLSLIALLLIRASKKRFVIEPGEQTMERLNRDVLEPCFGMKFDTQMGKLFSDFRAGSLRGRENFYSLRYLETPSPPAQSASAES